MRTSKKVYFRYVFWEKYKRNEERIKKNDASFIKIYKLIRNSIYKTKIKDKFTKIRAKYMRYWLSQIIEFVGYCPLNLNIHNIFIKE